MEHDRTQARNKFLNVGTADHSTPVQPGMLVCAELSLGPAVKGGFGEAPRAGLIRKTVWHEAEHPAPPAQRVPDYWPGAGAGGGGPVFAFRPGGSDWHLFVRQAQRSPLFSTQRGWSVKHH